MNETERNACLPSLAYASHVLSSCFRPLRTLVYRSCHLLAWTSTHPPPAVLTYFSTTMYCCCSLACLLSVCARCKKGDAFRQSKCRNSRKKKNVIRGSTPDSDSSVQLRSRREFRQFTSPQFKIRFLNII
jgi:hypothetical protein